MTNAQSKFYFKRQELTEGQISKILKGNLNCAGGSGRSRRIAVKKFMLNHHFAYNQRKGEWELREGGLKCINMDDTRAYTGYWDQPIYGGAECGGQIYYNGFDEKN